MAFDLSEVLKDVSGPDTGKQRIIYVPYNSILPDPANGYSMTGIEELARSIELVGLQQPPLVRGIEGDPTTYVLISGHRRYEAIGLLIKRGSKLFADGVPCILTSNQTSQAMRELQLLMGNADNRKLTPGDEAQQLARMSDCIRRLEAEGYKFPGRHRDWLSKMSGMSKTKIARLEAIQKHLSLSWIGLFTSGKLPESVAYAIQQIPEKYQELLFELCTSTKPKVQPASLTEYTVKSFAESVSHAESMVCTLDGGAPCAWKEQLIRAGNPRPGWVVHYGRCSAYNRCSACCSTCDRLAVCESVCPKLREKAQVLAAEKKAKDEAKEAEQAARREQSRREFEERHRKEQEITDGIWKRMGERRRELGLSVQKAYLQDEMDEEDVEGIERLETEGGADEDPFSCFDLYEPEDICGLADRLQCSIDYFYGRAPQPTRPAGVSDPEKQEISLRSLGWLTCTPPDGVRAWAKFMDEDSGDIVMLAHYHAETGVWYAGVSASPWGEIDQKCIGWWPLPDDNALDLPGDLTPQPAKPVSVSDTAPTWHTGDPPAPGYYTVWSVYEDFEPDYETMYWNVFWSTAQGGRPTNETVLAWAFCPPPRKEDESDV